MREAVVLWLCLAASASEPPAEWTSRLGISTFVGECEEARGLASWWRWLLALARGRHAVRSAQCEAREATCGEGEHVTGLQVRYARVEKGDRDLYDFRPRCGRVWQPWLGLKFEAERADHLQEEAALCTEGRLVSGVQVMRGRVERADRDYYNFKLRCGDTWQLQPLGLAFDGWAETKSATCRPGQSVRGIRVHRGFRDWGDVDTYEFQLLCASVAGGVDALGGHRPTRTPTAADRGFEEDHIGLNAYGESLSGDGAPGLKDMHLNSAAHASKHRVAGKHAEPSAGGVQGSGQRADAPYQPSNRRGTASATTTSRDVPKDRTTNGRSSTFGARAAEAEEILKELRAQKHSSKQKSAAHMEL
ncbi:hypothetical protein AB1Y20_018358 [Prymnesium parvum]|uniref:Uncharacterized protein n=1 Tax=Prymnesium parvum TaxID=97485 RepID=A0AB34JRF2_PRYPA